MGKFIEPIISPLGFDWKIGVSIITGAAAKEIVVSTMGVLYKAEDEDKKNSLESKIKSQKYASGEKKGENVFTPLTAFTLMLFVLLYFPCIAAVTAIQRESGCYKWALFSIIYSTTIAWILSFIVYNVGKLFI